MIEKIEEKFKEVVKFQRERITVGGYIPTLTTYEVEWLIKTVKEQQEVIENRTKNVFDIVKEFERLNLAFEGIERLLQDYKRENHQLIKVIDHAKQFVNLQKQQKMRIVPDVLIDLIEECERIVRK